LQASATIRLTYVVPETVTIQQPVISDGLATVAVDFNLIEAPTVLAIEYNGKRFERECNHEKCTEPLAARGHATFEIPLDGSQRADFTLLTV
jgi:hypothetical protein